MTQDLEQLRSAFAQDQEGYSKLCEWAKGRLGLPSRRHPFTTPSWMAGRRMCRAFEEGNA